MTYTPSDLPASARTLVDVIGINATLVLASAYGRWNNKRRGRLNVPCADSLTPTHRLVLLLGYDAAYKLARHFGGEDITVPDCSRECKRARIWADFMSGMSVAQCAAKHGVSERRIRQITAEERGALSPDHFHTIGKISTPAKSAAARRYGTLKNNSMIKKILSRFKSEPETPYGSLLASISTFSPKLTLLLSEEVAHTITVERAVELMVPCLPGEVTIKHGEKASLLILKPAKQAKSKDPLMIRVETPITPKSSSQNCLVINILEALAVSAVIDKMDEEACQPKAEEARN